MAGIKFDITGDNRNVLQSFNEVQSGVKQMQRQVEDSGASIEDMFKRIGAVAGLTFAGVSVKEFVRNVMNVRGEFQKLEVAFTTMFQSEEKAASLMNQLVKTAAITPFDLKGVADGAKQLLAYGIAADEVNETLVHLGDIAAGLSIPLGDLVYLYGTTMVQGRMFTNDLRQFQGRGIPIADELAKQFGIAKDKVGEFVTAGKVGAEQVKKAIMDMSSEGGKFGGLMEEQAKTINGQISNIEDAIDVMFNNIGKQNEGIINTALSGVSTLIENYEAVGKAIASAVAVYGVYKAAIMTVTAMQALQTAGIGALTVAETAHYGWLVLVEKAQKLLNATMLSNPYVLVATAIAGVVAIMMNMKSQQDLINDAEEEYNRKKEEAIAKEEEHKRKIEELLSVAGDEQLSTENRRLALVRLEMQYPSIFKKYDTEAEKLKHILDIKNQIAEIDGKNSVKNKSNELDSVNARINELQAIRVNRFLSQHGGYVTSGRNRTDKENAELTALLRKRGELQNSISKEQGQSYLANLTGISNNDLQKQINERRNLLAKMQITEKKYGRVTSGGAKGTYSADELQGQLQILEAERNKRNEAKYTPAQQKAMAKKSLDEAKKALADFDKSTTKYTTAEAEEARKKLTDAVSEAEKEYKKFGGKTGGKKTDPAKTLKKEQRYTDLEAELERKASRDAIDLEHSTRQAEIDAMEEGSKKTIAQIRLDYDRRKEEIDRGYEDLRIRKIEDAKKLWEANPANNGKVFDETTVDTSYTDAERKNYEALLKANETELARSLKAQTDMEIQAIRDYLKEYGTYQQQKLAIAQEYADKIAKAQREGNTTEVKRLRAEQRVTEGDAKARELAGGIDFSAVLTNVGNVAKALAEETYKRVQDYKGTDEYKNSSAESKKAISDLEARLIENGGAGSASPLSAKTWDDVTKSAERYDKALKDLQEKTMEHSLAVEARKQAEEQLALTVEGTEEHLDALNVVADAIKEENATGEAQQQAQGNVQAAGQDVQNASNRAAKGLQDFEKVLGNITSGTLSGFANGVAGIISSLAGKTEKAADGLVGAIGGKTGGIIGAILQIMDALGDDPTGFINNILDKVADTIDKILSQLLTDIVPAVLEGVGNILASVLDGVANMVTFGLAGDIFGGLFGGKSHEEEYKKELEDWKSKIDANTYAVEQLTKKMADKTKSPSDAARERDAALSALLGQIASNRGSANLIAGDSDKGYHSWYYKRNESGFDYNRFNSVLAKHGSNTRVSNAQDVMGLSAQDIQILRTYAGPAWADYFGDVDSERSPNEIKQYLETIGDLAEKDKEIISEFYATLTNMTFDDLRSNFKSKMMDMKSDAKTFTDDFAEMMTSSLMDAMMSTSGLNEAIRQWQIKWGKAFEDDNKLSDQELAELQREYNDLVQRSLEVRDEAARMTGYKDNYEQEASSKGYQAMGQDLGAELNGRFTYLQIAGENISAQMLVVVATLNSIASFNQSSNTAVIEIRDMLIFTNSYLEDMVRYAKLLYSDFGEKLDDIVNNTKKL